MTPELQALQGSWQAIRLVTAVGPVPDELAHKLGYVFSGSQVTMFEDGVAKGTGAVVIDVQAVPKTVDLLMHEGAKAGRGAHGVFQFAEGRLQLCIGPTRPQGFTPKGASVLVELERVVTE